SARRERQLADRPRRGGDLGADRGRADRRPYRPQRRAGGAAQPRTAGRRADTHAGSRADLTSGRKVLRKEGQSHFSGAGRALFEILPEAGSGRTYSGYLASTK